MENVVEASKYKIVNELKDLNFIRELLNLKVNLKLYDDLDIEPFSKFSLEFQAEYWYVKFLLLRDKSIPITEDLIGLFDEHNLNIIWLKLTDSDSFILEFIDGEPFVFILKENTRIYNFFKKFNLIKI